MASPLSRTVTVRGIGLGLGLGLLAVGFTPTSALASDDALHLSKLSSLGQGITVRKEVAADSIVASASASATRSEVVSVAKRADFDREQASHDAREVADWVVASGNNRGMPFVIVDKKDAKVFVFYAGGRLRGAAPALLGLAIGDDAIPGIGDRKLSSIRPEERSTPAGRFVAALDRNLHGAEILWVDYDDAISMHRVINTNPKERRPQRLATPTPMDNRISFGCINVPAEFFDAVVLPAFHGTDGIVYVLPERKSIREVFAS